MYYHASPVEGIKQLEPRVSDHHIPLVYFSTKRENTLVYLSNAIQKYCKETGFNYDGMGYIRLGQKTTTISGGEAQRIKLAKELGKSRNKDNIYILDEPTVGLSPKDSEHLLYLLREICNAGNTVIVTEHDIDVLSCCDYLFELGPKGGDEGGYLIAEGTPKSLKENSNSIIGSYLK